MFRHGRNQSAVGDPERRLGLLLDQQHDDTVRLEAGDGVEHLVNIAPESLAGL